MKKHAAALALLLAAIAAQAQTQPHAYAMFGPGVSHLSLDCTGAKTCESSDRGLKVAAGYALGNGLSLEAGYLQFGKFTASDDSMYLAVKPSAVTLAAAFTLPLGSDWAVSARLGAAQVRTRVTAGSGAIVGSDSQSKAKLYAGLGASYAISKTVKLELGVDSTQAEFAGEKGTLRLIGLGMSFEF